MGRTVRPHDAGGFGSGKTGDNPFPGRDAVDVDRMRDATRDAIRDGAPEGARVSSRDLTGGAPGEMPDAVPPPASYTPRDRGPRVAGAAAPGLARPADAAPEPPASAPSPTPDRIADRLPGHAGPRGPRRSADRIGQITANTTRVEEIAPGEIDDGLAAAWGAMQAADPDLRSPFFSPDFARIVGAVRSDARVAVIERGGQPAGIFAFHRQRFGRLAPLAGQISDYHGVVGRDGGLGPTGLIAALGAQAYDYNHVPRSQEGFCEHAFQRTTSPLIDLSRGFEDWRQERRAQGSAIKNAERKGRKLAREVGPLRFVANDPDPAVWDRLLAWKREMLAGIGVGFMLDRPWAGAVIDRVRATDTPGFGGVTSSLWAGAELVAASFSMRTASTLHLWFPTFNPAFERYSPGLTLLVETLRHAGETGVTEVDLGRGTERYKAEFANGARALCEGSVERGLSPVAVTRRLRKVAQAALVRTTGADRAEIARRAGDRLLSAGRLF